MGYADKLKQNSSKIQTDEKVLEEKVAKKKIMGRPAKAQNEVRNTAIPVALNQLEKEWIENHIEIDDFNDMDDYNTFQLGDSFEEVEYRTWCKDNVLFLNTLNDKEVEINTPNDGIKNKIAMLTEDRRDTGIFPMLSVKDNIVISNMDLYLRGILLNNKKIQKDCEKYKNEINNSKPARNLKSVETNKVIKEENVLEEKITPNTQHPTPNTYKYVSPENLLAEVQTGEKVITSDKKISPKTKMKVDANSLLTNVEKELDENYRETRQWR